MLSLRTRLSTPWPSPTLQPLAKIALTKIRLWNSWPSPSDLRFCALIEKMGEKAVFAAETLESALGGETPSDGREAARVTVLRAETEGLIQEAFEQLNQCRAGVLSREQTRAVTRPLLGIFDSLLAALGRMPALPEHLSGAQHLRLAALLRRSVEQIRLAVSGLREATDHADVLRYCAHVHALQRDGALAPTEARPDEPLDAALLIGLTRCTDMAAALESALEAASH